MIKYNAFISTAEIALVQHELLKSCDFMNMEGDMLYYISGVHDMAEKLMEAVKEAYPNGEGS